MVTLLVAAVLCDRLSAPEWSDREAAESVLKAMGPAAWSVILRAAQGEDAEVRARCDRLLAPYRLYREDERARDVLFDPWRVPDVYEFWEDGRLRSRVHRLAAKLCGESWAAPIDPWWDGYEDERGWWWIDDWARAAHDALRDCREQLGVRPPWFLRP